MTGDAGSLSLHSLSTANLQAIWRGIGVQRHILRLEGSGVIAVLKEDTTEACGKDALAYIAACAGKHYGTYILHSFIV